jgi:integrase
VFLAQPILEVMDRWRKMSSTSPWIFPSANQPDQPICASTVWRTVERFGREIGLEQLHVHQFRHTCATTILEQFADITIAQKVWATQDPEHHDLRRRPIGERP